MDLNIHWTDNAKNDLKTILNYLEIHWTEKELKNFSSKLDNTISLISQNPLLFQASFYKINVRRALITKHNTLYYRIKGTEIELLTIFDTRKNPIKLDIY